MNELAGGPIPGLSRQDLNFTQFRLRLERAHRPPRYTAEQRPVVTVTDASSSDFHFVMS